MHVCWGGGEEGERQTVRLRDNASYMYAVQCTLQLNSRLYDTIVLVYLDTMVTRELSCTPGLNIVSCI